MNVVSNSLANWRSNNDERVHEWLKLPFSSCDGTKVIYQLLKRTTVSIVRPTSKLAALCNNYLPRFGFSFYHVTLTYF